MDDMKLTIVFSIAILRYPFDWRTPLGYIIATTQQYITFTYMLFCLSAITSLGIGADIIAITVSNEIKTIIKIANKKLRSKKERPLALKRFTEIIEWHSMVKQ